ncbi:MAG TPA: alpha/beta hydrolase-fold protein [Allocoleopsis sp.]
MNYKLAGTIALVIWLTLTGWADEQAVGQSASPQLSTPQPSTDSSSATDAPLSYQFETYTSKLMGGSRTYGVVLPPGYEQNPTQRYPVIFLLHGGHGTPQDWLETDKGDAIATLNHLYEVGQLPPSIVITPDGNDKRGSSPYWDPQYIDGPNGKVSSSIGNELVKVVQSRYRTLPAPAFWAIGGLSSGGWGAMNVGLHHRDRFSILFSHSGYFRDKSGPQNSPINYVRTLSIQDRKRLHVYLDAGADDATFLSENRHFHELLDRLKIANVLHEFPGEHTWRYWREHLADSLTFVGKQFQLAERDRKR